MREISPMYSPYRNKSFKKKISLSVHNGWRLFHSSQLSKKILFCAIIGSCITLFFPWVSLSEIDTFNWFSAITGAVGYVIIALYIFLWIMLFSTNTRHKLKSLFHISLPDYTFVGFTGIAIMLMMVIIYVSLTGYSTITSGTIQINPRTSWIVFQFLFGFLFVFSSILNYKESKKQILNRIYVDNASTWKQDLDEYSGILGSEDKNMKLPI